MAEGSTKSNNVRAGAFILCGLAIGITVFIILSGWNPFQSRMDYSVRFTVAQGVDGLAAGSDVKVGGLLKGMVTEISPQFTKNQSETEQLESIIVKFQVDSDVTLWSNASVTRYMPLLGGGAWLNFDSVGFPKSNDDKGGDLLKQNGELTANVTGGILATLLGPSDAERTSKALQNIDKFTAFLTDIPKSWNEEVVPMLENVNSMTASIRKDYVEWSKKITLFLTHADSAALKIDDTLDDIPPLLVSAQKDLDQVGEILDENATKISETMDNIVVMTQDGKVFISDFRTESLVKINQILETGEKGIDSLTNSLNRIDTEITVRMPDISMMLANLRQASAQLKLTALEVRRSPWKLLYTPSTTEVAHENLYESARSFVMATNELESASLAFREIFEINPEMLESQPELKAEVEKYVFDALDRFKKAQERLFSEIVDQK
jgi:ABC-type transporter Mla subunit MlaD